MISAASFCPCVPASTGSSGAADGDSDISDGKRWGGRKGRAAHACRAQGREDRRKEIWKLSLLPLEMTGLRKSGNIVTVHAYLSCGSQAQGPCCMAAVDGYVRNLFSSRYILPLAKRDLIYMYLYLI